jgi:hypothetical protein
MYSKFKFLLILSTALAICTPAWAEGGEGGGNQQSPMQAIVQIAIAAILLRIMRAYNLP